MSNDIIKQCNYFFHHSESNPKVRFTRLDQRYCVLRAAVRDVTCVRPWRWLSIRIFSAYHAKLRKHCRQRLLTWRSRYLYCETDKCQNFDRQYPLLFTRGGDKTWRTRIGDMEDQNWRHGGPFNFNLPLNCLQLRSNWRNNHVSIENMLKCHWIIQWLPTVNIYWPGGGANLICFNHYPQRSLNLAKMFLRISKNWSFFIKN